MTNDELDELTIFWWGSDLDACTVAGAIERGVMVAFARYILENFAGGNND